MRAVLRCFGLPHTPTRSYLEPGLVPHVLPSRPQAHQAQQASMYQLVEQLTERNEALSGEVAALRKHLRTLTERRDGFLWL